MLPNRIRQFRRDLSISQQKLAETLGVSQQTIAGWEGGRTSPDRFMLARMVEIFQTSSDYLLGITNLPHPPVLPEGALELKGSYLSMAKTLQDEGIKPEDLRVMLEIHKRFSELNADAKKTEQDD